MNRLYRHLCMYICTYVYVHTCVNVCMHICIHISTYTNACVFIITQRLLMTNIDGYSYVYVHIYTYIHIYTHIYIYRYLYLCMYTWYACIHILTYYIRCFAQSPHEASKSSRAALFRCTLFQRGLLKHSGAREMHL